MTPHQLRVFAAVAEFGSVRAATEQLREPGSGTRASTEELMHELGVNPPTMTIGSNGAIREILAAGLGVAQLSRDALQRGLAIGRLVAWPGRRCGRTSDAAGRSPTSPNARSIRNAVERARLRHAARPVASQADVGLAELVTIEAADLLGSTVFGAPNEGGLLRPSFRP